MVCVTRINLKTDAESRDDLLKFCLYGKKQYLIIGWSKVYEDSLNINTYEDYYYAVREKYKDNKKHWRYNHCHNVFMKTKEGDLFWTRDLEGMYWICRVIGRAQSMYNPQLDIGAAIPVNAFKFGLEVPGQIKASFNRPRGGTCEDIKDESIIEFSKKAFNEASGIDKYEVKKEENDFLDTLPDFELEELIISYIQIVDDYYLLSNSIANKSTTVKIECEFINRDITKKKKAVLQVKGGKKAVINALDYKAFDKEGYIVYFFAPKIINQDKLKNIKVITREQIEAFYKEYKSILPESITKWENIL
ncbi:MAG: ribonuclease D [Oribacterium sp.]|nr:ribonuclease D [Oribacterium sp.]